MASDALAATFPSCCSRLGCGRGITITDLPPKGFGCGGSRKLSKGWHNHKPSFHRERKNDVSPARRTDRDSAGGAARMEPQTLFAKRFRKWREDQGVARRVIAARLEVTEQTLLNWEAGTAPSFDALAKLATVSGISADWWLGVATTPRRARG